MRVDAAGEVVLVGAVNANDEEISQWSSGDVDGTRTHAVAMRLSGETGKTVWRRQLRTSVRTAGVALSIEPRGSPVVVLQVDFGDREDRFRQWWQDVDVSLSRGYSQRASTVMCESPSLPPSIIR